jgi:hypothetical protein
MNATHFFIPRQLENERSSKMSGPEHNYQFYVISKNRQIAPSLCRRLSHLSRDRIRVIAVAADSSGGGGGDDDDR